MNRLKNFLSYLICLFIKKNKEETTLLKILPANDECNKADLKNNVLRIACINASNELDEYVILERSMYKKIFCKHKNKSSNAKKRLSIVKISYNGKSIHRAYRSFSINNFSSDYVALTPNSMDLLSVEVSKPVTLSRGCWLKFYWYHPYSATRISFRTGVLAIAISILIAILQSHDEISNFLCSLK